MKEQSIGYELEGLAAVKSFRPDFWLNLGDIIYADVPITGGIGKQITPSSCLPTDYGLALRKRFWCIRNECEWLPRPVPEDNSGSAHACTSAQHPRILPDRRP